MIFFKGVLAEPRKGVKLEFAILVSLFFGSLWTRRFGAASDCEEQWSRWAHKPVSVDCSVNRPDRPTLRGGA